MKEVGFSHPNFLRLWRFSQEFLQEFLNSASLGAGTSWLDPSPSPSPSKATSASNQAWPNAPRVATCPLLQRGHLRGTEQPIPLHHHQHTRAKQFGNNCNKLIQSGEAKRKQKRAKRLKREGGNYPECSQQLCWMVNLFFITPLLFLESEV